MTFVARFSPAVSPRHAPIGRRLRWLMLAVLCAMNACGGGLDSGGTGTQPQNTAQAVASGSIAGFGSIVVNGVHFDDRTAQITNADGAPQDTSVLKLGMQVRVLSGGISETNAAPNAVAKRRPPRYGRGHYNRAPPLRARTTHAAKAMISAPNRSTSNHFLSRMNTAIAPAAVPSQG